MKFAQSRKQVILGAVVILAGLTVGTIATANHGISGADSSPLITEVDKQGTQLDNHEARITNTEGDVKDLQNKTNTPPSPTHVDVPAVTTPTPTPEPAPVTIAAFKEIIIDTNNSDCEYTYSDGTTYQWHWKVTNQYGSWMTDGQGQNGHWVPSTQTSSVCDATAIGIKKYN